jgi:hypothetical protein
VPLRDVAQLWTAGDIDWRTLARWAREWRLAPVMSHAFLATSEAFGATLPEEANRFTAVGATRSEGKVLAGYTSARRHEGGTSIATIRAIRGLRAKAIYVGALTLPNRPFLDARAQGGATASYRRRILVPIRWVGHRAWGRLRHLNREPGMRDPRQGRVR